MSVSFPAGIRTKGVGINESFIGRQLKCYIPDLIPQARRLTCRDQQSKESVQQDRIDGVSRNPLKHRAKTRVAINKIK